VNRHRVVSIAVARAALISTGHIKLGATAIKKRARARERSARVRRRALPGI
jgi:hypothetical protein